ncbi:unnamed protein product [Prorocentrum cordatum]|nr:unnamed protein product [Polarella glacialis]
MLPALVGTPRRRIIAHRVPVDSTRGAFGTSESIFLPFFLSHSSSTRESACLWDAGAQPEVAATQRCCPQRGRAVLSPAADEGRGGLSSQVLRQGQLGPIHRDGCCSSPCPAPSRHSRSGRGRRRPLSLAILPLCLPALERRGNLSTTFSISLFANAPHATRHEKCTILARRRAACMVVAESEVVLGLMFFTYDCSVLAETRSACMDFELVSPFSRHWCFIRLGFARGELK